ncbi:hypothetical protein FN846DRAFT_36160 [Sphaerosporella brunnea]|uniref:Ribosomal protein s17 n=1 Tax=Sphaerosporella brunnea TaxID=1250544 RepID=A0A5J5FA05_9PEZI|nr:hypothetical protein FN846DRAFT_36160 [Sphaerosporella brunnea]
MKFTTILHLTVLITAVSAIPNGNNGFRNNRFKNGQNGGNASANKGGASTSASASASASTAAATSAAGSSALTLLQANVQSASDATGQSGTAEAGQSNSATDPANFINFCTGKTLTNGAQVTGGSCNGIVMGDIPSQNNMISSIITSPTPGQNIAANTPFTVSVKVTNLVAGSFTNPANTYYAAPQALSGGKIVGHTHVTIQKISDTNFNPTTPPDATTFAFFKGINDAGDGKGDLQAQVTQGLPAGFYRVCTMTSASNHQPVLMPVAQRGAQDDCQKFSVGQGGKK